MSDSFARGKELEEERAQEAAWRERQPKLEGTEVSTGQPHPMLADCVPWCGGPHTSTLGFVAEPGQVQTRFRTALVFRGVGQPEELVLCRVDHAHWHAGLGCIDAQLAVELGFAIEPDAVYEVLVRRLGEAAQPQLAPTKPDPAVAAQAASFELPNVPTRTLRDYLDTLFVRYCDPASVPRG